jgi:hypothetical protein
MEGDVLMFAQVMTVIVCTVGALVGIGLGSRVLWRMGSRKRDPAPSRVDDARMERLESAVDAIAIEVERISEGQRFTVGLLTERLPARSAERGGEIAAPSVGKRVNTPH